MPLFRGGGGMNAALSSAPTSWHTCHLAHAQNGLCRWNGSGRDACSSSSVILAFGITTFCMTATNGWP